MHFLDHSFLLFKLRRQNATAWHEWCIFKQTARPGWSCFHWSHPVLTKSSLTCVFVTRERWKHCFSEIIALHYFSFCFFPSGWGVCVKQFYAMFLVIRGNEKWLLWNNTNNDSLLPPYGPKLFDRWIWFHPSGSYDHCEAKIRFEWQM